MKLRTFLGALSCATLLMGVQTAALAAATAITLEEARDALAKSTAVVVDIREPSEHATGVAKGALLIPMGQFPSRVAELSKSGKQPIILMCNTQNRSSRLAEQLQSAGYSNISYVKGGMSQWTARGWPLVKP
jgi:rhodanese-related sulfurtransferase